jgi:hypothetical protein
MSRNPKWKQCLHIASEEEMIELEQIMNIYYHRQHPDFMKSDFLAKNKKLRPLGDIEAKKLAWKKLRRMRNA